MSRKKAIGSVYRDNQHGWVAALQVKGKRQRKYCRTKSEANAELAKLREAAEVRTVGTFGELRARYGQHVKETLAAKTAESYSYALAPFKALDPVPLGNLSQEAFQAVLGDLGGRQRQLSHDVARRMYRAAIRWGLTTADPLARLERPKHSRREIRPFSAAEVAAILEHLNGSSYGPAVRLAFALGLRGGELWGLQWSDWSGQELSIQRQACETSGRIEIKAPKTAAGIRRLLLPDSVLKALQALPQKSDWIFPGKTGAVTRRSNFAHRVWNPALDALGLDRRGFHHARHTAALLMLNRSRVPLPVVARILGHASPAVTLEVYAHAVTADLADYRNAFDSL